MATKTYFDPSDHDAVQTHWTPHGVFKICRASRLGVPGWELWLGEKALDWSTFSGDVIRKLKGGELNHKLDFDGRQLTIPDDPHEWNRHL